MNFLFHTIPSNSFTWPLPQFMEKVGCAYWIHLLPQTIIKSKIQYAIWIIILGRETKTCFF